MSARGPGSDPIPNEEDVLTNAAGGHLQTGIERLERLEEDRLAVMADKKEVFAELKGEGFDVKTIRKLLALRKKDKAKLQEENAILLLYANSIGCADLL